MIIMANLTSAINVNVDTETKNKATEINKSNLESYGSYAAFVENENQKIKEYNFNVNTKFSNFQFIPIEEIEKSNGDRNNINNNLNNNNMGNNNTNLNTEILMSTGGERMNTGPSRRNTERSKESKTETVSSKSITPSQEAKVKKVSHDIANDLMKKK